MKSGSCSRSLRWLGAVALAAGGTVIAGGPVHSAPLSTASPPGLCLESLREADLEAQLLCLRKLEAAGPAAAAATQTLSDILARSDGTTDHLLIASILDVLRSLGPRAAPAAETLSSLLPHRHALYRDRDKVLVVRLRAYILVTLTEIGFPSSAIPALLDALAHPGDRMSALEVGAAARAVRALGLRGCALAPYLIDALDERFSVEEFSLERYDPQFPPQEATTIQLEAVRSLGQVCSPEDPSVMTLLRQLAADSGGRQDRRVAREAQSALELILKRPGRQLAGPEGRP